jgi:hypothetical protein
MIQDFIPARTSAATGIVIKQTVLERNKYPVPQPNITSSIAAVGSNNLLFIPGNTTVNISITYPITSSGVTGLSITGSITEDAIDSTYYIYLYDPSATLLATLDNFTIVAPFDTYTFSGLYYGLIPSGSYIQFLGDGGAGNYQINNFTASLSTRSNIPYYTENLLITGSPIQMYEITASTGGTMPNLFGLTSSQYTGNNVVNITQVWSGSTPSLSGSVPFTQSSQTEFYNGELSGSFIPVDNYGELNPLNPIKHASTTILTFNSTGSSAFGPTPGSFTWQSALGYNGTSYLLYVKSLVISEIDLSGNNIETPLTNLTAGSKITFTVSASVTDTFTTNVVSTVTGVITSITPVSAQNWRINLSENVLDQAVWYNPIITYPTYGFSYGVYPSSSVLLNPYIGEIPNYNNSDFNPIINNALLGRPNQEFFDVDFSSNAITAVNRVNIISASRGTGSATPSTVPASNYTTARSANPRYNGCENTSPGVNIISGSQLPSVESLTSYFIYTPGGLGNTLAERSGSGNYKVGYIIDELGNTISADPTSSAYLPSFIDAFAADTTVVLSPTTNQTIDTTEYTVFKPAVISEIILYNDTGSLGTNHLISGTYNPIYFTVTPGVYTNPFATEITQSTVQTVANGNTVTMSFNEVVLDQALGWSVPSDSYYVSSSTIYRAKITSSFTVDNLVGGGAVITNLMNNGTILDTFSFTSTGVIPVQLNTLVFPKEGDKYWVRVNNSVGSSIALNNTSPGEFTITPVTSSITASSPHFTTGATISSVLTSSVSLGNAYGGGFSQVGFTGSGFDTPSPLTIQQYDEIRFEGNESKVSLIISSSTNNSVTSPRFYVYLSDPIDTSAININYFAFRRWSFSVDNLILNSPGTVMGAGLILPKYPSPTLIKNLPSIVENLTNKGIIST